MSPSITLDGLSYRTPDGRPLFDKLTLAFGTERTGLVGRNGAGKTTLVRLVLGELHPSAGTISVGGRLGVLRQAVSRSADETVADLLGVSEALARLRRIEAGQGSPADFDDADWTLESRLEIGLERVGLRGLAIDRPALSLSGGEATRAALAGLIAGEPDLLLLDEPTNNLDAAARDLVADVLADWRGGAIVVSHDRTLLRAVDRTVELSGLGARVYGGGYDLYAERKAEEAAAAERDLEEAERSAARVDREAQASRERQARRDSAGRRFRSRDSEPKMLLDFRAQRAEESGARNDRQATRTRERAAEALVEAQGRVERVLGLAFGLPPSGLAQGKSVLAMEDVSFAHPGRPSLFEHLSLRLVGPERMSIDGPNGAGKSSLIRLITGELAPSSGRIVLGVEAALLDQGLGVLRGEETLIEGYRRLNPGSTDNQAHAALAKFLFRNSAARRRADELSGGERLRAALACVLTSVRPPQLLILDEPTNHLDLESVVAVEAALADYDGALLVVSHDRDFLEAIGVERRLELAPPHL